MDSFFSSFLHSPWMLLGLAVLAIPPIIHLLNRRRYDVVDWGAMQFLQVSEVTRRRLMLEEVLLHDAAHGPAGRAGVRAGRALPRQPLGPSTTGRRASNRDLVLVIDGSASMAATDDGGGKDPFEKCANWALALIDDLAPGDSVAVLQAKEQVIPVVGELSVDMPRVRERLKSMPAPAGSSNWPAADQAGVCAAGRQPAAANAKSFS